MSNNNISVTVRLPHDLNEELKTTSTKVGMTKTNLIRLAIHECLAKGTEELQFPSEACSQKDRLVLNINQTTLDLLNEASAKYGQSVNAVVTAVCLWGIEYYSRWLQLLGR